MMRDFLQLKVPKTPISTRGSKWQRLTQNVIRFIKGYVKTNIKEDAPKAML